MPYLRFKGFTGDLLRSIAPRVVDEFAQLVGIAKEKVKIEQLLTETITQVPCSVEILMFPRKQEVHDAVASALNKLLCECGYDQVHIFYVLLSPSLYYKNGEPLAPAQPVPGTAEGVT
ncbi:DUF1904 family protein [Paenibacillus piri]|uniref:DUF1904 family protein n=1 Tax=Paenibacillus piri TaxID=2547395 RepID=A0A4R5KEY9_9BACL|nr:DUF1904 family protein [Paenibacillus piri]TDF93816.1 DUF1904 family protein [Paenibacillus piri]